ncbi:MAG: histidine--tRNA ligase, partial [Erysipelotrichaceae bacterium]|nr:histidine--tRNA ligase [Erysipelotrichaceae bacterium]
LRPEGTAAVVRSFVENKLYASPDLPVKLYYMGEMARHERPQKGRLRLFHQFGVEALGQKSPFIDVETIILGFSILQSLGIQDIKVCLNTLGDDQSRQAYREALQEYFQPHLDSLCADCRRRYQQNPLRILDCKVDADKECMKNAPKITDYLNEESKEYFDTVLSLLDAMEIPYEIDEGLVRGLDYYTHTVFEIVSVNKDMGSQSTILAGGRYDGLIPYYGGPENTSGIGWALGMERLLLALEAEGISLNEKPALDTYVLCLDPSAKKYAFQTCIELRSNGYSSEMDMMDRSFKAQFKAVDRTKAEYAVLIGKKEFEEQTLTIKDIANQTQDTIKQSDLIAYMDQKIMEGAE